MMSLKRSSQITNCAKRLVRAGLVFALAMIMSGCVVGPDYCGHATPVPDTWHQQLVDGEYASAHEVGEWWTLFDDPTLTQLVDCAEKHNINLYAAYTRISQARSQECIINAAKKPMLSATGAIQSSLQSANSINLPFPGLTIPGVTLYSLGLDTGWEPDLFGRVARQLEAAEANTCSQVEAYRDVLVTLYGDVAQSYVQIRTLQQQLLIACRNVELQKQSLELARKRVEGGVSPNVDLFQAESNLSSTEAEIPTLELQLNQALNRLSTLLGHYPGAMHCVLAETGPIPNVPARLPHVIPCDMIRQRPDVRQAERQIAAASANVGVALADLLPTFRLGGTLGLTAREFGDLFSGDSFGYGLGPSFSWPILQGGRIRCNIDQKECAVEEAIANYEQSLLRAAEQVENAIVSFNKNRVRAEALTRTVAAAEKSLESVLALYRAGQVDFQNVLDTQRTLFQAQNGLAIVQGQIITDLITFYRALGGGWDCNQHCEQPCVRLHCSDRCPPENATVQCDGESTRKYFDVKPRKGSDGDSLGDRIRDRGKGDGDEEDSGSGDKSDGNRPSDNFFDDEIKKLEERLKQTPPDKAPVDLDADTATPRPEPRQPPSSADSNLPAPTATESPDMRRFPPVPDPPRVDLRRFRTEPLPLEVQDPAEIFKLDR